LPATNKLKEVPEKELFLFILVANYQTENPLIRNGVCPPVDKKYVSHEEFDIV